MRAEAAKTHRRGLRARRELQAAAVLAHVTTTVAALAGLVASQHTEALDLARQHHFTVRALLTSAARP